MGQQTHPVAVPGELLCQVGCLGTEHLVVELVPEPGTRHFLIARYD